jgi:glycosyltransferase involved in cell wall biosynthesis
MARSLSSTARFVGHVARDLAGTLAGRWNRFVRRVTKGRREAAVAVDVFPFFERMTGVGWYEWNLLAAMDRRDDGLFFNLYAHTFRAPDEPAAPVMPGHRRMRLRVHHLPPDFLFPIGLSLKFLRGVVEPLLRFLDGNRVAFAPNFFMPRRQLPFASVVVPTIHDLAFKALPETVAPETIAELERNLQASLDRAPRVVAVSEATARDAATYLGIERSRLRVVHEGLDPRFESDGGTLPEEVSGPYLLFVGTLEPRKNISGIIKAFEQVVEHGWEGTLVLVGRWGWRTGGMRRDLEASPARHRIVHLEHVSREQLPALYREAEALLFPSWLEGFGLPILEAMACGCPVITADRSAMPEVAGPAAIYVDPADPEAMAVTIVALLDDGHRLEELSAAGRERVQQFSWDRAAAATAQILRDAAGLPLTGADEYRV